MSSSRIAKLAALAMVAISCNPPNSKSSDSSVKTLDNLVAKADGGKEVDNKCGVEFTKLEALPKHVQVIEQNKRVKGPLALKNAVLGTLAAAPVEILRPFMFAGGVIEVMNTEAEAVSECSDAPVTETERQLAPKIQVTSCWKVDATSARIVLPPNEVAIRKETLRQLALFFTEYLVDRGMTAQAPFDGAEWQAYLTGVDRSRKALEVAFFEDLQRSRPEAHTKIIAAVAQDRRANFVYAEAIDSYYCSSTGENSTRSVFRDEFPEAWKVFTDKTDEHSPVRLFGE